MEEKLNTLYSLCEALSHELKDVDEKIQSAGGGMSAGDLELVDKLSHAMKSIKTTIAMIEAENEEGGYSERYMPYYGSYRGNSYRNSRRGNSYERNRSDNYGGMSNAGRRNARRDNMGRYSGEGYSYADSIEGIVDEMRGMMDQLPEEKRREVQRFVDKMDRM